MKEFELNRIKEVGKKTIADFVHSESGSVGIKSAATIGAFAAALALSQSNSEAIEHDHGNGSITTTVITAI